MSDKKADVNLELKLLDNGIDFILRGIDELFDEKNFLFGYSNPVYVTTNRYKYGCLHLFSGFLLLLKERLSKHLPELIFKGGIFEVRQRLASRKLPNTIDLDDALERLATGPKVEFSKKEITIIRSMQDFRNNFEHYEVSVNKYQLWDTISKFLLLIDKFMNEELHLPIEDFAEGIELFHKIQQIESVHQRFINQIQEEWFRDKQNMLKELIPIQEKVIEELEWNTREEGTSPLITCPECYEETLITCGEYAGICTNKECNYISLLSTCDRCGEIITVNQYGEFKLCDSCEAWFEKE